MTQQLPGATDFGRDTRCDDSLHPGRLSSGLRLVAERCYHRLTTPRGTVRGGEDEAIFGTDLPGLVGATDTTNGPARIESTVKAELAKDAAVDDVAVTVTATTSGPYVSYEVAIVVTTGLGPFELVLEVSAVSVEKLGLHFLEAA